MADFDARPYADAAWQYHKAGWLGVIPIGRRPAQKSPPPTGYTGWAGVDPSGGDVQAWIEGPQGGFNVGLHIPTEVYVPDFDIEGRKEELERAAGVAFPPTWTSTSRGPGFRHQAFYRAKLPEGRMWMDHPRPGMDSVHIGHRYAVVWPSVHPDTGETYSWYDTEGELYEGVPTIGELAELPFELVMEMSKEGAPLDGTAANDEETLATIRHFRGIPPRGKPCHVVRTVLVRELDRIAAGREAGSIREPGKLYALSSLGIEGHAGVGHALRAHQEAYVAAREQSRGEATSTASGDWWRQVRGAVGKKLTETNGQMRKLCDCDPVEPPSDGEDPYPEAEPFGDFPEDPFAEGAVARVQKKNWLVEDLDAVLSGERKRVEPELARRSDGVRLLYRGKEHVVAGEPESGKTWFALMTVRDILAEGGNVLYVDFEDDAFTVVGRLLDLGVSRDLLRPSTERFRYVRPEGVPAKGEIDELLTFPSGPAELLVYDGWTEGASVMGQDIMGQDDIAKWRQALVKPALNVGCATLTTDHVVKDKDARGRYSIGAQHKLAGLTGVMFTMEVETTWGRGSKGRSRVLITKDRNGGLRPHGVSTKANLTHIGDLVGDASSGEMTSLILWPPSDLDEDDVPVGGSRVPQHMRKATDMVLEILRGRTTPMSTALIEAEFRMNKNELRPALAMLTDRNQIQMILGERKAKSYLLAGSPFAASEGSDDPSSTPPRPPFTSLQDHEKGSDQEERDFDPSESAEEGDSSTPVSVNSDIRDVPSPPLTSLHLPSREVVEEPEPSDDLPSVPWVLDQGTKGGQEDGSTAEKESEMPSRRPLSIKRPELDKAEKDLAAAGVEQLELTVSEEKPSGPVVPSVRRRSAVTPGFAANTSSINQLAAALGDAAPNRACESCGGQEAPVPPTGLFYACPSCYPATFGGAK